MSIQNPMLSGVRPSLAADPQATSQIAAQIGKNPKEAVHEVAQQFEALFMETLLKSMRATHFDDEEQSNAMQTFHGLQDQQLAQALSSGSGVGLARILEQQISRLAHLDDEGSPTLPSAPVNRTLPTPLPLAAMRAYQQMQMTAAVPQPLATPTTTDKADVRQFVRSLLPQAQQAAAQLGAAPQLLVAHAALESGWGKRTLRNGDGSDSHNLFGIKASSDWQGATTKVLTTEYVAGVAQKRMENFRSYASYQEAFADYAQLLISSARYQGSLKQGSNIQGYAQGLQMGGYATDPRYAKKLVDVMATLAQNSA